MFRTLRCALGRFVGEGRRRHASADVISRRRPRPLLLQAAAVAIAVVVVAVDLHTPTDILSFFYAVPIFVALLSGSAWFFWSLAAVLGVASVVAYESTAGPVLTPTSLELNGVLQ